MINTDQGIISLHGNNIELMADLSVIVHTLCYDVLMSDSDMTLSEAMLRIMHAVELGTRTDRSSSASSTKMDLNRRLSSTTL